MSVSVVVPVYNEMDCIAPLIAEIEAASAGFPLTEIVVVDDCSDDKTPEVLRGLKSAHPKLRIVRHAVRSGQSTGLWTGISHARGPLIVTLDGDGQNNPADIPLLYAAYQKSSLATPRILVAGQRIKRQDDTVRKISSRMANAIRSFMLKDGVRDTGCSLKLFRRDDFLALPFFNHLHRYIPALMLARGVELTLIDVSHRPRLQGVSKYGFWDRLWVGIADLVGVRWLLSRTGPVIEVSEQ